jgi:hypothetical protein
MSNPAIVVRILPQTSILVRILPAELPIPVNISDPLIRSALSFFSASLQTYIDEDRVLKTLLNYGEDKQSVILASRYGNLDSTVQLKLLQPLPVDIDTDSNVFISREVNKSIVSKMRVRFTPPINAAPYLRPRNTAVPTNAQVGNILNNVTLNTLTLISGSIGATDTYTNKTFEDEIFRKWYSYDFNSSELNIDFTDYNNFMFYGSAALRLAAFREKLRTIEKLKTTQAQFTSTQYTGSLQSAGSTYVQQETAKSSVKIEDIIRGFDRYEQYLYFTPSGSDSPYSASAYYADTGQEYNLLAYWPKSGSTVWPVGSDTAANWYETQSLIAQRFDEFNENNLVNTIPTHIREDDDSAAYVTFVAMTGHFFDTIKPFIDQLPYINSRYLDPNEELSKDLINEIAESVGFTLPTINSVYNLADNILGTETSAPRRDFTAETYKRLLHNLPLFAKAKGTKTAINTLLQSFGISPQLINVKESGTQTSASFNNFDEYSTGIDFDRGTVSYITLPLSQSLRNPRSLQFNFTLATNAPMTILNGDSKWALRSNPHPTISTLGRIELVSGSTNTVILSSSYHSLFGDELLNVTLRNYNTYASLLVSQVEGEDIVFSSSMAESVGANKFVPLWQSTDDIYMGGSGSLATNRFDGTIDEVRLWGINLSDEVVMNTVFDASSNAGDTYTDAATYLYMQLSFNKVIDSLLPLYLINESPYIGKQNSPAIDIAHVLNINTSDFSRYNRTVRQKTVNNGISGYVTNKIKVVPPPVFTERTDGLKRLFRTRSIVEPLTKRTQVGRNKVIVAASPTEIINQNIIRNIGLENINDILGIPTSTYSTFFDQSLKQLKEYYELYYYVDVNINKYVRILSDTVSVLDQILDYFIPSKATLLKGIVIEPNILEQVNIRPTNIQLSGATSRLTMNAANSLTGSKAQYNATFNVSQTIKPFNFWPTAGETSSIRATFNTLTSSIQPFTWNTVKTPSGSVREQSDISGKYNYFTSSIHPFTWNTVKTPSGSVTEQSSVKGDYNYFTSSIQPFAWNTVKTPSGSTKEQSNTQGTIQLLSASIIPLRSNTLNSEYLVQNIQHENWYTTQRIISGASGARPRTPYIDIQLENLNKFSYNDTNQGAIGSEPYNRVYTRKLFQYEISSPRIGGTTSIYTNALKIIPPSADFTEIGVVTFFNNPTGIYNFKKSIKTPAYPRPIDITAATTWSYGTKYMISDVVYQQITNSDIDTEIVPPQARIGNGKYYVFKTRPAYSQPADGSAFYSGSVPSYIAPSLDRQNWDVLHFSRSTGTELKRVVYDTYTIPSPPLNNYKTTTISADIPIDVTIRYVDQLTIPLVSANSYVTGDILIQNIVELFAVQSNASSLRLRLYNTTAARDADILRTIDVTPTGAHGVLLDTIIDSINAVKLINPIVTLVAAGLPPQGKIYFTVNNTSVTDKTSIDILLYYFAIEIEPRIPFGYLQKHYRFFRDNSTATKRRNYVGCLNTTTTTFDGASPVEIFLSEGTQITVSPRTPVTEIIPGGGGTLDVL